MSDMIPLLTCHNVQACRDEIALTMPVSFVIGKGSYLQLRGTNGSGKSTLLRHLAGLLPLRFGTITCHPAAQDGKDNLSHLALSYQGHDDAMSGDLSGYENYEILTAQSRMMLVQSALYERPVATYSAGQRQKLRLHMLDDSHDIWLLDEPAASLDEANLAYLEERIAGFLALGGAVIATTHTPLAQSLVSQSLTLAPYQRDGDKEQAR